MASGPITSWQIDGETVETMRNFIFLGSKITADGDCSHEIKVHLLLGRKVIKKQRHYFANKFCLSSQSYGFSSSHVWMWELDYKEAERWRIDAFELWCWRRLLRVPWTARRSNQSTLKEMSWIFIGRTDGDAETPVLWPPDEKNWLTRNDPDAGKDWRREKGMTEDEMVGWHHRLNGHEWIWVNSRSWWWSGKPGMQQSHLVAKCLTQLSWTEQEDSTCQGATKPRRCSYGACMPRAHPLQQEKPPQPE